MSQENIDVSSMLKEVGNTASIIGVKKLTELLKDIQKSSKEINDEDYQKAMKIVSTVCQEFEMSLDDFFSNKRKNNRRSALACVFYVLNKELSFDYNKINFVTKKSHSFISILIKEIEEMSKDHPFDKKTLAKLDNILLKIKIN